MLSVAVAVELPLAVKDLEEPTGRVVLEMRMVTPPNQTEVAEEEEPEQPVPGVERAVETAARASSLSATNTNEHHPPPHRLRNIRMDLHQGQAEGASMTSALSIPAADCC